MSAEWETTECLVQWILKEPHPDRSLKFLNNVFFFQLLLASRKGVKKQLTKERESD